VIAISIPGPWIDCVIEQPHGPRSTAPPTRVINLVRPVPQRYVGHLIALHSPRRWSRAGLADGRVQRYLFGASGLDPGAVGFLALGLGPRGHILAVATLCDCHPAQPSTAADGSCCTAWGDQPHGTGFHIVLGGIQRLDRPVPVQRNRSGPQPWPLSDELATQLATHLPPHPATRPAPAVTGETNHSNDRTHQHQPDGDGAHRYQYRLSTAHLVRVRAEHDTTADAPTFEDVPDKIHSTTPGLPPGRPHPPRANPNTKKGMTMTTSANSTSRVRRPLTADELHTILSAVRDAADTRQLLTTAVRALYTALLADTGHTFDNLPAGEQIDPGEYAIPTSQWQAILAAITGRAHAWGTAAEVGLELALNLMPSHYDDPQTPVPDLPLPDYRPLERTLTLSREAVDVIDACETHLAQLRSFYGPASDTYQTALHSWHRNLAGLFTMNTGADTHIGKDGELSLFVRTSSGLVYGLIFHGATRHCTTSGCDALINDDGTAQPSHHGAAALDHKHTPSYPLDGPRPGGWSFHS